MITQQPHAETNADTRQAYAPTGAKLEPTIEADGTHGGGLTPSPATAQPKPRGIEARTGRPLSAYPRAATFVERYVAQFSRALGLRPSPTQLSGRIIKL